MVVYVFLNLIDGSLCFFFFDLMVVYVFLNLIDGSLCFFFLSRD